MIIELRRTKTLDWDLLFVFKTAPILPARLSRRAFLWPASSWQQQFNISVRRLSADLISID